MVNIRCFFFTSGKLGNIPDTNEIVAAGIQQFGRVAGETHSPLGNVAKILGQLGRGEDSDKVVTQSQSLVVGEGLAALPKKLVEKIQANEYIDFNDLPPAKGKSKVLFERASTRYKWPAWLVYDQNFRQEAANNPSQLWS